MASTRVSRISLWMKDDRIGEVVGNIQQESRLKRGPFDNPDPAKLAEVKESWERKKQERNKLQSVPLGTFLNPGAASPLNRSLGPQSTATFSRLVSSIPDEFMGDEEEDLVYFLRNYTSNTVRKILPCPVVLPTTKILPNGTVVAVSGSEGFLGARPPHSSFKTLKRTLTTTQGSRMDNSKNRQDVSLALPETGNIDGFFSTQVPQFAAPPSSRGHKAETAGGLETRPPLPAVRPPNSPAPNHDKAPSRNPHMMQLGLSGTVEEWTKADFQNVKAKVKSKNTNHPVVDFSFYDIRYLWQLFKKEPRQGMVYSGGERDQEADREDSDEEDYVEDPMETEEPPDRKESRGRPRTPSPENKDKVAKFVRYQKKKIREQGRLLASGIKLSNNSLDRLAGFSKYMPMLIQEHSLMRYVDLSHNCFMDFPDEVLEFPLMVLLFHSNRIDSLEKIQKLAPLRKTLRTFSLIGNPVAAMPGYREVVLSVLPNLRTLDFGSVTARDHEEAKRVAPIAMRRRKNRKGH